MAAMGGHLAAMRTRRHVLVHGRVQGVGFRVSVARRAEQRGIAGWVRNRSDGAVEAVFEGEPGAVESLVEFCRSGPRGASVERVEVADEEPDDLSWFDVR
jgi:acylphosphatase